MKVIQELATLYSALLLLTGESGEVGDLSRSISAKQIITGTLNLHLSVNMQNVRLNTSMWWWFTKINWDESVIILGIITKVQLFIFEFTAHFSVKQWGNITFTFESESVVLFCFSGPLLFVIQLHCREPYISLSITGRKSNLRIVCETLCWRSGGSFTKLSACF